MKRIVNAHWFPIIEKFNRVPDVDVRECIFVYMEDTEIAGFFDSEQKRIVVNIAPNVLAGVAKRYGLSPRQMERIALAVFLEEAAHSRGENDETKAASIATNLVNRVSEEDLQKEGGLISIIRKSLECAADTVEATK